MTFYKVGMKTEFNEDGLWLDFRENTWIFVIRDATWTKEELRKEAHADVTLTFVQKGIVDAFLVEIFDCMECSDAPFCMKDADDVIVRSLDQKKDYGWELVAADGKGKVLNVREGMFDHVNSVMLKEKLKARLSEGYTSDDFDKAYAKLAGRYEPFELEPFAVFVQKSGGKKK